MNTRWIQKDYGYYYMEELVWECDNCDSAWQLDGHPKEHNVNYCQQCGAKITEFVEFKEANKNES